MINFGTPEYNIWIEWFGFQVEIKEVWFSLYLQRPRWFWRYNHQDFVQTTIRLRGWIITTPFIFMECGFFSEVEATNDTPLTFPEGG